jgi:hypothetical protein
MVVSAILGLPSDTSRWAAKGLAVAFPRRAHTNRINKSPLGHEPALNAPICAPVPILRLLNWPPSARVLDKGVNRKHITLKRLLNQAIFNRKELRHERGSV